MGDRIENKQQNCTTETLLCQIFLAFSFGEKCHAANYVKCSSNWLAQIICRNPLTDLNFIEPFAELATQLPLSTPQPPALFWLLFWLGFFSHCFIWK